MRLPLAATITRMAPNSLKVVHRPQVGHDTIQVESVIGSGSRERRERGRMAGPRCAIASLGVDGLLFQPLPAGGGAPTVHCWNVRASCHPTPSDPVDPRGLLLAARGLTKSFGQVRALAGVDFSLGKGQVHVLMGENGAGKSTLIKCLSGVHAPDGGSIDLDGKPVAPRSTREAESLGISTVFQEVNLIPHMSVAENVTLGRETRTRILRRIDHAHAVARADAALARLGLAIDVRRELSSCSIAHRQLVAIARALDVSAKVLILDEPTSSLDRGEVQQLFRVVRRLRDQGMGIVFITHFLDQVYEIADRITILRDGALVGEFEPSALPRIRLVSLMIGRDFSTVGNTACAAVTTESSEKPGVFLSASGLAREGSVEGINLAVRPSDTLGLAGLLGSGRTETTRLLFGADRATGGEIRVDGVLEHINSPRRAMKLRIAMTTEDRKGLGIIPNLSVRENILLALQARRGMLSPIPRREADRIVSEMIRVLAIKTPSQATPVVNLSGGNQQKVLLARWLATDPRLLILDEPTRGIDVGAKAEIERLIESLRSRGMAVILVGSDLEEIVRICARVVVLRDRRQVAQLEGASCTVEAIMAAIAEQTPCQTNTVPRC